MFGLGEVWRKEQRSRKLYMGREKNKTEITTIFLE